ncbi:MAG: sigma-70 family RNA polymerase sigma factor [Planctomycetota bacterium]|jgi:RNA polymerase sigma-70 factor (ECF subfamily)
MNNGQQKSMQELAFHWTKAQPVVAAFISSVVPNFHDVDDILGRVAITLVRKCDQYDPNKSFVAWAIGMAKYEILNHRREKAYDKHIFDTDAIKHLSEAYESDASYFNDLREALSHCLKKVKGRSKQAMDMRYIRGNKPARIAEQLDMTVNAVFVLLHRIRLALRECIKRRLDTLEIRK